MTLFLRVWLNRTLTMTASLTAYLGLGSNLGDRLDFLLQARQRLAALPGVEVLASSRLYQSAAMGGPAGQSDYLNAVVAIRTDLTPESLLNSCLEIEQQLGRVRQERWGARTLDIDLLLIDNQQRRSAGLTLPHPRLHERPFVLCPLQELAPDLVHPVLGVTVTRLVQECGTAASVTCLGTW